MCTLMIKNCNKTFGTCRSVLKVFLGGGWFFFYFLFFIFFNRDTTYNTDITDDTNGN